MLSHAQNLRHARTIHAWPTCSWTSWAPTAAFARESDCLAARWMRWRFVLQRPPGHDLRRQQRNPSATSSQPTSNAPRDRRWNQPFTGPGPDAPFCRGAGLKGALKSALCRMRRACVFTRALCALRARAARLDTASGAGVVYSKFTVVRRKLGGRRLQRGALIDLAERPRLMSRVRWHCPACRCASACRCKL